MEKDFSTALIAAQSEAVNLEKNAQGYGYKYTDLPTLISAIKPILAKHGFAVIQTPISSEGANGAYRVGVRTILVHVSGQQLVSEYVLPLPSQTNPTQSAGAAITYAKRYALAGLLNISSDEDTDARVQETKSTEHKTFSGARSSSSCTCDNPSIKREGISKAGKPYKICGVCDKFINSRSTESLSDSFLSAQEIFNNS